MRPLVFSDLLAQAVSANRLLAAHRHLGIVIAAFGEFGLADSPLTAEVAGHPWAEIDLPRTYLRIQDNEGIRYARDLGMWEYNDGRVVRDIEELRMYIQALARIIVKFQPPARTGDDAPHLYTAGLREALRVSIAAFDHVQPSAAPSSPTDSDANEDTA